MQNAECEMCCFLTLHSAFHILQVVRILNGLFVWFLYESGIAAVGIRYDLFFLFVFHKITSRFTIARRRKMMIAFWWKKW